MKNNMSPHNEPQSDCRILSRAAVTEDITPWSDGYTERCGLIGFWALKGRKRRRDSENAREGQVGWKFRSKVVPHVFDTFVILG